MLPLSDSNRTRIFPFVNVTIIVLNVLVYLYSVTLSDFNLSQNTLQLADFFYDWAVVPREFTQGVDCQVASLGRGAGVICPSRSEAGTTIVQTILTLFSSMFMHGSLLHIAGNMLFLWVYGDNIEGNMGHFKYLVFYLLSGVLASAAHILFNASSPIPSLGASGAIAGVLAAYLVLYPRAQIRTLIFLGIFITVINVPSVLLIGLWFLQEFYQGTRGLGAEGQVDGVARWAHIGGFIAGLILVFLFRGRRQPSLERDYLGRPPGGYMR